MAPTNTTDDRTETEHTTLADINAGDILDAPDVYRTGSSVVSCITPDTTPDASRRLESNYDGGIFTVWELHGHHTDVILYCPETDLYAVARRKHGGAIYSIKSVGSEIQGRVRVTLGDEASRRDIEWLESDMIHEMVWGNSEFAYISPVTPDDSIDFDGYDGFAVVDGPVEVYPVATDDPYDIDERLDGLDDGDVLPVE